MPDAALLLTCEHAVNAVPERWQHLFQGNTEVLETHLGWDRGAAKLAQTLARELSAPCFMAQVSRLLLDHNRSPHNRMLWSEFSRDLSPPEKTLLLEDFYHPFRDQAGSWLAARHGNGERLVHIAVHSFTPVLDSKVRDIDVGLLYDTARPDEAFFADIWRSRLLASKPTLKVRFNVPYRGRSDCHGKTYRYMYGSRDYVFIELEINQALVADEQGWKAFRKLVTESLRETLSDITSDE
ncbi:MAG: N-formylglutamate amidohydrolase [Deltaproteobacteria bacterium]|jgi:predicted N-formylglutamate amidohydrolase|nr:N-formylglutamate amidohydrolase [Deltaproteobacteria bacterium]MDH4007127.1 N-formylglutamate amidohydrolase [Desulfuromonadales bacterium]